MDDFYTIFTYDFASLFAIVNPVGMSAVFLHLTKEYSKEDRHRMAYRVAIYGTLLLLSTFFLGPYALRFFGIPLASIQIAGGLLVFYTARGMFETKPKINPVEEKEAENKQADITFFPLTMPITAGAGAMAVTITLSSSLTKTGAFTLAHLFATVLAIILVFVSVAICYRYADSIFNRLGYTGTSVVTRLTAFVLLAISITIIWEGVLGLVGPAIAQQLPHGVSALL